MKTLCLAALAITLAGTADASDTKPRKDPEPVKRCTTWTGHVRGNDPDVAIEATLCRGKGNRVHGKIVWTGRSGSSTRRVSGTWTRDALTLRDDRIDGTPSPGWRFCPIERYTLKPLGDRKLAGDYRSSACHDEATITLAR